jgi:membrane protein
MSLRAFTRSFIDFFRDDGPLHAAALTCYFTMAVVPFCLLLVSVFGYFLGGNREIYDFFLHRLVSSFPQGAQQVTEELRRVVAYRDIGLVSSLVYCLLSFQLFNSLESAVNRMFGDSGRRPLVLSMLFSVVVVTLLILFLSLSLGATSAIIMVRRFIEDFLGLRLGILSRVLIRFVLPLALVAFAGTALYKLLPRRRVPLRHALRGGIVFAALLEGAKHLFTLYVMHIAPLGSVYGSLSAFVVFILWLYYSSCILLIGAKYVRILEGAGRKSRRSAPA